MNKQEFMAMSLPYWIKVFPFKSDLRTITTLDAGGYALEFERNGLRLYPILRPLSDLTKEIEHNGETFIPVEKLGWGSCFSKSNFKMAINNLSLHEALNLIKWRVDIANLIEKGEAININTLEENPYK